MKGYAARQHPVPVKRYCRTMDLKDDPALIAEYVKRHSEGESWPEILAGIREVGILEMEIYILGNRLFMIVETPLDFDWDTAMEYAVSNPRIATTLFSTTNPQNVLKNVAFAQETFDEELLREVREIIGGQMRVSWRNS